MDGGEIGALGARRQPSWLRLVAPEQSNYLSPRFGQFGWGDFTFAACLASLPVETLDLIGQYHAGFIAGGQNLKRITFDLCRHEAAKHQSGLAIVG